MSFFSVFCRNTQIRATEALAHPKGEDIDRPRGVWPNPTESWQPIWLPTCTKCAVKRDNGDNSPYCVYNCPNNALTWGPTVDEKMEELRQRDFRIFELPSFEGSKEGVIYATK